MPTNKTQRTAVLLLLFPAIALGQVSAKRSPANVAKPMTASLSGKAFQITKAGDVKPALLAHVCLFAAKHPFSRYTLQRVALFDDFVKEAKDLDERFGRDTNAAMVEDECHKLLRDLDSKKVEDLKDQAGSELPTYTAETDEMGTFSISQIQPGDYLVRIHGQAGNYDALWIDKITLAGGEEKTIKLASTAEACQIK